MVDSAARVAQVLVDLVVRVQALVAALLPQEAERRALVPLVPAQPLVRAQLSHEAELRVLVQVPVVAGLVVVAAVRLLNRQWFSAAMVRTTP